ncbi:MAG: hypothetical protein WC455_16875 [Dehalococcoidia bacterium]
MNPMFIVLFKDGSMQFYIGRQRQENFQADATIWTCECDTHAIEFCDWAAHGFTNTRFISATTWEK